MRKLIIAGCQVVAMAPATEPNELSVNPDALHSQFADAGIDLQLLPFTRRGLDLVGDIKAAFRLTSMLRRSRVDVVHIFNPKPILMFAPIVRIASPNSKLYVTFTGLGAEPTRSFFSRVLLCAYALCTGPRARLIFETKEDLDQFSGASKRSLQNDCFVGIASGVDLNRFAYTKNVASSGVVRFILASRLVRNKGIFEFIEAASLAVKKWGTAVEFAIMGDYELNEREGITSNDFEQLCRNAGVLLLPACEVDDMPMILGSYNVVVLPSYREGYPKILMEAASCGRAMIASKLPSCENIIRDGKNGYLCDTRSVSSLVACIDNIIAERDRLEEFGILSREIAEDKFGVEKVLESTLDVYRKDGFV